MSELFTVMIDEKLFYIFFVCAYVVSQVKEHSPNKSKPLSIHPMEFCLYTSLALGCNYLLMSCKAVFSLASLPLKTFNYLG